MATSIPLGRGNSIGWENPKVKTTVPLPLSSTRYPIPTISSSFFQPLVTPSTALNTSARASPWTADCESFSRVASRCPSFCSSLIPPGTGVSNLPLGPCTETRLPWILTFTPAGTAIGFFPILDIISFSVSRSAPAEVHDRYIQFCNFRDLVIQITQSTDHELPQEPSFTTRLRTISRRRYRFCAPDDPSSRPLAWSEC